MTVADIALPATARSDGASGPVMTGSGWMGTQLPIMMVTSHRLA